MMHQGRPADTASAIHLLVVEDKAADTRLFRKLLAEPGLPAVTLKVVGSIAAAKAHLASEQVDAILLDPALPEAQGLEAIHLVVSAADGAAVVVLTESEDDALALQALQQGAQDVLVKGQVTKRSALVSMLRHAIERQAAASALVAQGGQARETLQSMVDGVVCVDTAGRVTFLNAAAEAMTGWRSSAALGSPMQEVLQRCDAGDHGPMLDDATLAHATAHPTSCLLLAPSGATTPVEFSVSPMRDQHSSGAVIVLRDATASREQARQMAHAAQHDMLTGLPNRLLLGDRIARAITAAPRRGQQVAVLFVDLDGFKQVNDTFGHAAGDRLLQSVSRRLMECVRQSDTVSRQGGDEFVILLSEVDRGEMAADVARRMLKAVGAPHFIDQQELRVQASIGVSVYPTDGIDADTLIKHADTAMYQAKRNGWRYRFYKPAMNARTALRLSFEEGLRRAFDRRELTVVYQPRIALATGLVVGAEALLQWLHPTRGAISAAEFVPAAERCGMMPAVGNWMLREACSQARAWRDDGVAGSAIAISVTAAQFRHSAFVAELRALLADTGLPPDGLELGLPEEVLMQQTEPVPDAINILRARGVRLALDGFGAGISSLTQLRGYPIDGLLIDPSLVQQLGTRPDDGAVVSAIVAIAASRNLHVVAKGVGTPEERCFLEARGCGAAQGPYFGKPVAARDFARLLETAIEA